MEMTRNTGKSTQLQHCRDNFEKNLNAEQMTVFLAGFAWDILNMKST
jgi:hypothetical protein